MTDPNKDAPERIWMWKDHNRLPAAGTWSTVELPRSTEYIRADLANPIAALVMRERAAAEFAGRSIDGNPDTAGDYVAAEIRALPLTCTDAELMAAVAKVPWVAALVLALRFYADEANWLRNGQLDGSSGDFTGGPAIAAMRAIEGGTA